MINIALETNDKEWFNQLTNELNKLEKEDNTEISLFNPKSSHEGYYSDLFEYEYYICQTDCDFEDQPLAVIDNKIYGNINSLEILNKVEFIVQLKNHNKYKNGDKISKLELDLCDDSLFCPAIWLLGYIGGQADIDSYCTVIKKNNEILDERIENLKKYNDLLKSELKTLQNNYFNNKEDNNKKFKWKFWKKWL